MFYLIVSLLYVKEITTKINKIEVVPCQSSLNRRKFESHVRIDMDFYLLGNKRYVYINRVTFSEKRGIYRHNDRGAGVGLMYANG